MQTHFGADFQGAMLDFGGLEPQCTQVLEKVRHAARTAPPGTLLRGMIGGVAFFDAACTPLRWTELRPEIR